VVAPRRLADLGAAAEHAIASVNHETFIPSAVWAS
jgi:hypothetical protein